MNLEEIKSARRFAKEQGWEDSPADTAIDYLIAEIERIQKLQHIATKNALIAEIERRFDHWETVKVGTIVNYLKTVNFKDCQR